MSQELIYTSAPKGLQLGSSGFSTVMRTKGLSTAIAPRLEELSGYRELYSPNDPRAASNPVAFSHVHIAVGASKQSVLSRVCYAGLDYSHRTNKFAHHVVLEAGETVPAGPAWLLAQTGFMRTTWDGNPTIIPVGIAVPNSAETQAGCGTWAALTGDAGWAGVLAETAGTHSEKPVFLVVDPQMDALQLLREAIALLPPAKRWQATFSTYYTSLPSGVDCRWRCILSNSPEAAAAKRLPGAKIIDLTSPLGKAQGGPLVAAAIRGGQPDIPPTPLAAKGVASPLKGAMPGKLKEEPKELPPAAPLTPKSTADSSDADAAKQSDSLGEDENETHELPPPPPRSMRKLYAILGVFLSMVIAVGCSYFMYDTMRQQRETQQREDAEQAERERQTLLSKVEESRKRLELFKTKRVAAEKEFEPLSKPPAEIPNSARLKIASEEAFVEPKSLKPKERNLTMQRFGHALWQLEQLNQANNNIATFNATKAKEFAAVQEIAGLPNALSGDDIKTSWSLAGNTFDELEELISQNGDTRMRTKKAFENAAKAEQSWKDALANVTDDSEAESILENLATADVQEEDAYESLGDAQVENGKLKEEKDAMTEKRETLQSCLVHVDAGYIKIIAEKNKLVNALQSAQGKYSSQVTTVQRSRQQSANQFIAGFTHFVPLPIEMKEGEKKLNKRPLLNCELMLDIAVSNPAIIETRKTENGWGIVGKKSEGDDIPVALFRLEKGDLYFSWITSEPIYRNALLYSRMRLVAKPESFKGVEPTAEMTKYLQMFAPAAFDPIALNFHSGEFASGEVKRTFHLPDFKELFLEGKMSLSNLDGCESLILKGERRWELVIAEDTQPRLSITRGFYPSAYDDLGVLGSEFIFKSQYPSLLQKQPKYSIPLKEIDTSLAMLKARSQAGNEAIEALTDRINVLSETISQTRTRMENATSNDGKKKQREELGKLRGNLEGLDIELNDLRDFQTHLSSVVKQWEAIDSTIHFQVVLRVPPSFDTEGKETDKAKVFILAGTSPSAQ